jgi:serine protease
MYVSKASVRALAALVVAGAAVVAGWGPSPATRAQSIARDRAGQGPAALTPTLRRIGESALSLERAQARRDGLIAAADLGLDYIPGEALVRFKPDKTGPRPQASLAAVSARTHAGLVRWSGNVALVRDPLQPDSVALAAELAQQPEVLSAEPNYVFRLRPRQADWSAPIPGGADPAAADPAAVPNDPEFDVFQWNFPAIGIPSAWDINPGGSSNLIVAVVDAGITTVDDAFLAALWTGSDFEDVVLPFAVSPELPATRLVNPLDLVFFEEEAGVVLDMVGHGTHIASTIAQSTNDAVGLAGIAYNVQIMPVKVCLGYWELQIIRAEAGLPGFGPPTAGLCPYDAIIDGIRRAADMGARVINVSLGGPEAADELRQAIEYAVSQGAFVTTSMGNDFERGNLTNYPAAYMPDIDGAMAVTAIGRSGERAFYSSTGPHAEIAAPGGSSRDGTAGSGFIYQTTLRDSDVTPLLLIPRFDRYASEGYEGTSMASPHVAGIAALIMSQAPSISPAAVEKLLVATARDIGAAGRDEEFGFGLVQPRPALFGFGIRR